MINNLRIKILIKNNVIRSKEIVIDIIKNKARIRSYDILIKINIKLRDNFFIYRKVYIKKIALIFSKSIRK